MAKQEFTAIKGNTSSELEVTSSMLATSCSGVRTGFQKLLVSDSGADRLVRRCDYSGHSVALLPTKAYVSPPKSVRIAAQAETSGLPLLRERAQKLHECVRIAAQII